MADAVLFTGRILLQDQNGEGIITKVFSNQSVVQQTLRTAYQPHLIVSGDGTSKGGTRLQRIWQTSELPLGSTKEPA